jgi:transcriptional regulator with XRE-family HTH domain
MPRGKGRQPEADDDARRKAFANALDQLAREMDMSQSDLAQLLGLAQQTISKYISDQRPPENPTLVFAMERKLGVPPGFLSHHLGYLPIDHVDTPSALSRDPLLSPEMRKMFLSLYRNMLSVEASRSEGSPKA